MKNFAIAFLFLCMGSAAHARYNEKAYKMRCTDVAKVTKEAIAYSLVGAWEPYANHKCFAKTSFQYFRPSLAQTEGDIIDPSKLIEFRSGRDSYAIEKVTAGKDEYQIQVKFKVANKVFSTAYRYVPDPEYTGRTGICGFVTNPTHKIVRADCINQAQRKILIQRSLASVKKH